jgi:hypothetical protein
LNKIIFVFAAFFATTNAFSQFKVTGKVIDRITEEPLAFASIIFNNDQFLGARTDIDGKFSVNSRQKLISFSCSYIGYKKQIIFIDSVTKRNNLIIISLEPLTSELQEVVIRPGENPANSIIEKVIANKDSNNPENISSFRCTIYNKTIYDFLFNDSSRTDSIKIMKKLGGSHLMIMESVTEKKFLEPDRSEEIVTGTKVSGFKNPSFVSLATDFQPFSFYDENIKLFDINYLNPVSRGSLNNYKFHIEDTLFQNSDTVYLITYKPLPNKNFDGLTGLLYINTNKYAIQNVIATPYVAGKLDLKIQQQYTFLENKYWFPEQLNYVLTIREYPSKKIGLTANGRSYIDHIEINVPLGKRDFSVESVKIDNLASAKDSLFWARHRNEKLNIREVNTYRVMDSIGEKNKFETILLILEKLTKNRIPVKFFDIDLPQTLVYNKFEGTRPGLSIVTNEKAFTNLTLGGFLGYGLKDDHWKYGGKIEYNLSKKHDLKISLKYQNNLIETGNYGLNLLNQSGVSLRSYMAYRMDEVQQNSFNFRFRAFRYTTGNITLNHTRIIPRYLYEFQDKDNKVIVNYINSDLTFDFRFAFKERIVNSLHQNINMGTSYPVLSLLYSRGIKNVWNSSFDYNKIEARIEQSFFTKKFGTTSYRVDGGFIDRSLPYGLLFTGEGSADRSSPVNIKNTFQTMKPYEFLSDRYVNFYFSHNFGSLLLQIKKFRPDITLHSAFGWGNLSDSDSHQHIEFRTKEKIFLESGMQFDNIVKVNYVNLGYLGFGCGAFYRYGFYSNSSLKDNMAFKLTMTYSSR